MKSFMIKERLNGLKNFTIRTLGMTTRPCFWLTEKAETIHVPITCGTSTVNWLRPSGYDKIDFQANENVKNRSQYGHKRLLIGVNNGPVGSEPSNKRKNQKFNIK